MCKTLTRDLLGDVPVSAAASCWVLDRAHLLVADNVQVTICMS